MDALTTFGVISVTAMLVFYALDERSPWAVLAFAGASWASALYALHIDRHVDEAAGDEGQDDRPGGVRVERARNELDGDDAEDDARGEM